MSPSEIAGYIVVTLACAYFGMAIAIGLIKFDTYELDLMVHLDDKVRIIARRWNESPWFLILLFGAFFIALMLIVFVFEILYASFVLWRDWICGNPY
jgi:hypothetical protein